jgi:3-deoxy-D-manno-octulosonic-acid transferase
MFVLYEVLLHLVFIVGLPFFLLAGLIRGKYLANFRERLGFYRTKPARHDVWIHGVSVGETLAAKPVVDALLRQRPGTSIVFTTTTLTGQAQAQRLFPDATVAYFPFDFSASVKRFLDHHQPRVFATMETEIWPNVTRLARARGVRMLLANGRLSDRSYPRYRRFRMVVAPILRRYDRILARDDTDRQRFIDIGAEASRVEVGGNVKFDFTPDESPLEFGPQLEQWIARRPVLLLASTRAGEDEMLIPLLPHDFFTIIAPRKPERFDIVAGMLRGRNVVRRSELSAAHSLSTPHAALNTLLLDSIGELARIYRYATVAFIGGSLVDTGGHNPIEAAAAGVPVSFGPHMSNFREIASVFLNNEAAVEVKNAGEVIAFARRMASDPVARRAMSDRAWATVNRNRGAAERTAARIVELLA